MKIRMHYFILWCLIKVWPKLFLRYYAEYNEAFIREMTIRRKDERK